MTHESRFYHFIFNQLNTEIHLELTGLVLIASIQIQCNSKHICISSKIVSPFPYNMMVLIELNTNCFMASALI